jgi:hypothetical protein
VQVQWLLASFSRSTFLDYGELEFYHNTKFIYQPFSLGFFCSYFLIPQDRVLISGTGPWFWGSSGLFTEPHPPLSILQSPQSPQSLQRRYEVRLPNLPLHMWSLPSLIVIGNALGKFYYNCSNTLDCLKTTFARIYVQMDFNNRLPAEIIFTNEDYK